MDITFLSRQNFNQVSNILQSMLKRIRISFVAVLFLVLSSQLAYSQISTGGVLRDFGINATLYPGVNFGGSTPPVGTVDWFKLSTGRNVIIQDASTVSATQTLLQGSNPTYEVRMNGGLNSKADVNGSAYKLLIDAVWARDMFGGSGGLDNTAYVVSSKNAADPAVWYPGIGNVLGKNDLIDVAAHMFRDVTSTSDNLIFTGIINRAEPGGSAYMDFEFFIQNVGLYQPTPTTSKFNTGGPDMGHTSFRFAADGSLTQLGDMIYNVSLSNGGATTNVEVRVWVSRTDYDAAYNNPSPPANMPFSFGDFFDGAGTNAPYGYASIKPKNKADIIGYVNLAEQNPATPPWGSRNTKMNILTTSYLDYAVTEVGLNLTGLGIDNKLIQSADPCTFPWKTLMIKTRSSESFTSSLKDFAGPYAWGTPSVAITSANATLSCSKPTVTLTSTQLRDDVIYDWRTSNGHFSGATNSSSVTVDKAGTYYLDMIISLTSSTTCTYTSPPYTVNAPADPFITGISATTTVSCNGTDGSISVTVSGGTSTFTYSWTGPSGFVSSNSATLYGLTPGTYTVTVTDYKECSMTSAPITVQAKTVINYNATVTNVLCYGQTNGSITLETVTGGVSPLTYSWSNGKTTQNLLNIGTGTYTLTITDGAGCKTIQAFTVTQPSAALTATVAKTDDTNGTTAGTGTASLTVTGGTQPYSYSWIGPGTFSSTTEDLNNLDYGSYSVTITDANSCTTTAKVFIYQPENCFDGIDNDGNGLTDCDDPSSGCKPATPVIAGDVAPCLDKNTVYTINSPVNDIYYNWTYPGNATYISGQGTNTITVKWTTASPGQICVTAENRDPDFSTSGKKCNSEPSCINITPSTTPSAPSTITKNQIF